ncbi:MAG: hypothetical protein IJL71_04630 [Oscillospiraceae bacterium]|nr:hypothetical protein [Oscillospiraceae bacterium]
MFEPYEKKTRLLPGTINAANKLGPYGALILFQDAATEDSYMKKTDYYHLKEESGAFWIITKSRVHFNREPVLFEDVTVRSWANKPSSITGLRNYVIENADGKPAVIGVSEWTMIDIETRKLRRISSTSYPLDAEHPAEKLFEAPFHRQVNDFTPEELVYTLTVRPSDTDMSFHTNNTVYCRYMMDAFPVSFFMENAVSDFEIRYGKESHEGEELGVYRREDGKTYHLGVRNSEGTFIVTASLTVA